MRYINYGVFLLLMILLLSPAKALAAPFSDPDNEDSLKMVHWIHMDPADDSVAGISLNKAYQLLEGRPSKRVLVAVIDSGFDLDHEDLKDNYWLNVDEIAGNGRDDDNNGYVDDLRGWNFIGGQEDNVVYDTYELTREYKRLRKEYEGQEEGKSNEFEYWLKVKEEYESKSGEALLSYAKYETLLDNISRYYDLLKNYLDVDTLTHDRVSAIESEDSVITQATGIIGKLLKYFGDGTSAGEMADFMESGVEHYSYLVKYGYNLEFNPRMKVGDDYSDKKERHYGNNQVGDFAGMMGSHGTHVAGIIAAIRDNDIGVIGVADNVKIIPIRAVPNGDERDKDIANAIYYAVDNGAGVINMSFGKSYSPDRDIVEKAIRYARKKDVLIVHAAGNSAENKDNVMNYPTRKFIKGNKEALNMMEVAANSKHLDETLPAKFTSYGKSTVDLFAPGVSVLSAIPGDQYKESNGTSMASPVVAGVAALLRSYFPELSAEEIRDILIQSSYKYEGEVYLPGTSEMVPFSDLTISGGLVNAYEAVKIAMNRLQLESR